MATLATTNVKSTATVAYFEGINLIDDNWRSFTNYWDNDSAALKIAALTGVGDIGTWDSPSPLDTANITSPATNGMTLNYQGYGIQVLLDRYSLSDIPNLLADTSRKLGAAVSYKYASLAFGLLAEGFSDATYTTVDGKGLFDNTHTTATTTRSNYMTSSLDRTGFFAAVNKLQRFPNFQDQFTDYASTGLVLIVSPENYESAVQILNSGLSSGEMQINAALGMDVEIISSPLCGSDTDDWWLTTKRTWESPINLWSRSSPYFTITEDQDNRQLKLGVDFAIGLGLGPQPDGALGSKVTA